MGMGMELLVWHTAAAAVATKMVPVIAAHAGR